MILDHVSITVNDLGTAAPFYDAVMAALEVPCVWREADGIGYGLRSTEEAEAASYLTILHRPGVVADRRHWAFRARDRAMVCAFHAAGLAAGRRDDGAPGLRPHYHAAYYGAFLLDPDGNRVEAVCHRPEA
ncbi:VOC family protein [Roseococcus suduntuyensis]|uniref:Catechol 2,3-dioxygenase-like lactoylglutathione lyase family enzyme n=1 Tax=Roseococcus suduntuyensis TaxID=455361 RepID=A0A840AAR8_9PROT|nr:VOC family protein [Roseococcus suduntuyensis]MBB3897255.1 catechol 2,3-dioxygenase-like lactoylglutathione lyase family enzyme [Roseococcus suduntuyensis]